MLFIRIKIFLSGDHTSSLKNSSLNRYIIYAEEKRYWNLFKPIVDEFEKRMVSLLYLTSSQDDPVFTFKYQYIKAEFIGKENRAFARLNLISADIILMTTPGLDVYQLKRSKSVRHYCHILHAPSDASLYRLFGLDYFDSVLLTGDYQAKDIRTLETQRFIKTKELVTVGCPYLDVYAEKIKGLVSQNETAAKTGEFTILVSPSWGPSAILSKYGRKFLEPLIETGWNIIIRPHPQSKISEKDMLDRLTEEYKDHKNLIWDYERDNIFSLLKADVMISDFSGVIFDYAFLCDKPVLYINQDIDLRPYDAYDICLTKNGKIDLRKLWQFRAVEDFGIELGEKMFGSIGSLIKKLSDNNNLAIARQKAKDEAWMYRGEAGKRIVDFMIRISEGNYKEVDHANLR
jgi:hypothetical protein